MLINELNGAIIACMDIEEIKKRMQSILDDAVAHFNQEEALFREWDHSEEAEHAKKHAQAVLALGKIMKCFKGGVAYEWIEWTVVGSEFCKRVSSRRKYRLPN